MRFWDNQVNRFIFLTKNSQKYRLNEPTNIILSPEYYWVKKVDIPVSTVFKARSYADSIMEDYLPSGGKYDYDVFSIGKYQYIIIAYDKDDILNSFKEKLNDINHIRSIYWSQTIFQDLRDCISLGKNHALVNIDGIVLIAPDKCKNKQEDLQRLLRQTDISKHSFGMNRFTSYSIPKKVLFSVATVFGMLLMTLIIDLSVHKYKISQLEGEIEDFRSEYHLPKTSFEFNSIQNRLIKIYDNQKKIRKLMHIVQELPLEKDVYINSLSLNKDQIRVDIKLTDEKQRHKINRFLKKYSNISEQKVDDLNYKVTIGL